MSTPKPRFFLGNARRNAAPNTANQRATPSGGSSYHLSNKVASGPPAADQPLVNPDGDRRMGVISDPSDQCPICKNDRYLNPKLRLMVSKCHHKMCESCLDRLFSLGPEPCPVCGQTIRKNQFQPQIFENLEVQKEVAIRRRTAKVFNKQPEDFATVEAYNDYLEEYESITFALIHSIGNDLAETERKIRAYEAENRNSIDENEERLAREKERLEAQERGEREWREFEKRRYLEEEERKDRERAEERKRILQQLEEGKLSPSSIMAASAERLKAAEAASSAKDAKNVTAANGGDNAPKLKFLANLARPSARSRNGAAPSGTDLDPLDEADYAPGGLLDPLSDYQHASFAGLYDSHEPLYTPIGSVSYKLGLGPLVAEREREQNDPVVKAGGFRADEVFEKAIREAVMGLWEAPKEWERLPVPSFPLLPTSLLTLTRSS